jgi:hypothetical protein
MNPLYFELLHFLGFKKGQGSDQSQKRRVPDPEMVPDHVLYQEREEISYVQLKIINEKTLGT